MGKKQRTFTAEYKLRTVLESYASNNASETAQKALIHITQLNNWKKQLLQNAPAIFVSKKGGNQHTNKNREEELEKIIGKQAIEIALLKKASELLA
jgi:transposase-like protein